jgi:hypothetical protein
MNTSQWSNEIIPIQCNRPLRIRLDKNNGCIVQNGTETYHSPSAEELIEICTLETKNKRFYS